MKDGGDFPDNDFEWEDEPERAGGDPAGPASPTGATRPFARVPTRAPGAATASRRRLVLLVAAVALVVVAVVVALVVGGGGGRKRTSAPTATSTPPTTAPRTASVPTRTTRTPAPSTTPAAAPIVVPATPTLHPGDRGPAVRTLQRALRRLGYTIGAPDGIFGPKTQAAVVAFQRAHGLTTDGVVGRKTVLALNRALRARR